jgi:hypothetical protein
VDLLGRRVGGYFKGIGGERALLEALERAFLSQFRKKMGQFDGFVGVIT